MIMVRRNETATVTLERLTQGDLTTVGGLLAEYDAQAQQHATSQGWCGSWRTVAYDDAHLPRPEARGPLFGAPDSWLTDEGKAQRDASVQGMTFDQVADAIKNVVTSQADRNITWDYGNAVLAVLGLGKLERVESFTQWVSLSGYFNVPKAVSSDVQQAMRAKVTEALQGIYDEYVTSLSGTQQGSLDVSVGGDNRPSRRTAVVVS